MHRRTTWVPVLAVVGALGALAAGAPAHADSLERPGAVAAGEGDRHGDLHFPADEHAHGDGLDYWWGAADVVTTSGNRYTVSMAYTSFWGATFSGHQLYAHQGPYVGRTVLTESGPAEWGHPEQAPGAYPTTASVFVPAVSERLVLETRETDDGAARVDAYERTSLDTASYRLMIDQDEAEVHPTGELVRLGVDLAIDMHDGPPLLAGGTGTWWYGIPETFGYPSRSFQYMQAARHVHGTLELGQPDGSVLAETVDAERSRFVIVHEYDATPEDIPAGFAAAQATQMHPRYAQHYQGGMPWELMFFDLGDGAQLKVVVMAFHHTPEGTARSLPIGVEQPTYRVLATLRLPSGRSVALDDLRVEHLSYREIVGRVPTAFVSMQGHWIQAWQFRLGHPGGRVLAGDGTTVEVPAFDLGIEPLVEPTMPAMDTEGRALTQRVPLTARGSFGGCPVDGFGWSELIINWHGRTEQDPWFTGGALPEVPESCGEATTGAAAGNGRPVAPESGGTPPPRPGGEGCQAMGPMQPACTYTAQREGGIGGFASEPGGWTVTIARPGRPEPIVVTGFSGYTMYACGIIRPGDRVEARAEPGSGVMPGDPGFCS